jgi:hypothetical protein
MPLDGETVLIVWGDLSERTIQIIVAVPNTTGEWIELSAAESVYRLLAEDGSVAADYASFDFAAPRFVAAGEVGYLVGELLCSDCPRNEFAMVESVARYLPATVPESSLVIENERLAVGEAGELEVIGEIINQGSLAVESVDFVAILLGARGQAIGCARTVLDWVPAGARVDFRAGSGWGRRLRLDQVDQVLSFVSRPPSRER